MQILFIYSLINTIKGASSYHMKEDFLFSLFFVRERHKARDGLLADQRNFNLKIHKLSISKINSILKMHAI